MKRYQRQMILSEIGVTGQQKLSTASVLVVGAGGLGVVVASYLVAMGIGHVGICDFDDIEESNLHRQFCYMPDDIGQKKATVLSKKLRVQNPAINITDFNQKVDKETISSIAENYQLICDCTDQGHVRMVINNYCAALKKPLVHGAVSNWEGYLTIFHYKKNFSLNDLFDFSDYLKIENCNEMGINSAVCGLIGSYMTNETLKIALNLDQVLEGKIMYINALNNQFKTFTIKKRQTKP
ncbi:MAG: thiamine biosynthesis protein ThiF [Flavobacterium sp. BFFFF2]|nr:MAG: thiamine biosynthesis protein ThiF [Flavobacterium sp. BFFFF2]